LSWSSDAWSSTCQAARRRYRDLQASRIRPAGACTIAVHGSGLLDERCADLDERDRALLHAVFAWAGAAVGTDAGEVEGFALPGGAISDVGTAKSCYNGTHCIEIMSFSWGVSNTQTTPSTGQSDQAGKVDLSDLNINPGNLPEAPAMGSGWRAPFRPVAAGIAALLREAEIAPATLRHPRRITFVGRHPGVPVRPFSRCHTGV
jgi:hypothetical protein